MAKRISGLLRQHLTSNPASPTTVALFMPNPNQIGLWRQPVLSHDDKQYIEAAQKEPFNPETLTGPNVETKIECRCKSDHNLSDIILPWIMKLHIDLPGILCDELIRMIIRDFIPAFQPQACSLVIIKCMDHHKNKTQNHHAMEWLTRQRKIAGKSIDSSLRVFLIGGHPEDQPEYRFSVGHLGAWVGKGPPNSWLSTVWQIAHKRDYIPNESGPPTEQTKWTKIREGCTYRITLTDLNPKHLLWYMIRWFWMNEKVRSCNFVLVTNTDKLSSTKQDTILGTYIILIAIRSFGPSMANILITKPNTNTKQITEKALEELVAAGLRAPTLRLNNETGRFEFRHRPRQDVNDPQQELDTHLRELFINADPSTPSPDGDPLGINPITAFMADIQKVVTFGRGRGQHPASTRTDGGLRIHMSPENVPTVTSAHGDWNSGPLVQIEATITCRIKTKEEKEQEKREKAAKKKAEKEAEKQAAREAKQKAKSKGRK